MRGHGTHLFVHRADADPEAARHVLDANFGGLWAAARICCLSRTLSFSGLPPTRPRARAAFNPASVRLRMTLPSNSAFCSSPQNA